MNKAGADGDKVEVGEEGSVSHDASTPDSRRRLDMAP